MTRLPSPSGKEILTALHRGGFVLTHVRGSHHYLRKPGTGLVVVPVHGNRSLPAGTFHSILRQAGLTTDEFQRLLQGR
ncbi:MAG TPA: type II toxin-antitoxin system HicA family toxin [Thermoanaerobaculia bacterium]|nr:type II toxin-antitoxin system HicA family toxin [Thermoanaerobaculia bacterium]